MKFSFLLFFYALGTLAQTPEAITGQGNGGIGVVTKQATYLYDLYENSLHQDYYFNHGLTPNVDFQKRLKKKFFQKMITPEVRDLIALKLTEINEVSPITALILLRSMEMINWTFSPQELKVVDRPNADTPLELSNTTLINLAIRRNANVSMNSNFWDGNNTVPDLDDANKAALIFHETIHSYDKQAGVKGRILTAYLFSQAMAADFFSFDFFYQQNSLVRLPVRSKAHGEYQEYKLTHTLGSWFTLSGPKEFTLEALNLSKEKEVNFLRTITIKDSEETIKAKIREFCQSFFRASELTTVFYGVKAISPILLTLKTPGNEWREIEISEGSALFSWRFQLGQYSSMRELERCESMVEPNVRAFFQQFE